MRREQLMNRTRRLFGATAGVAMTEFALVMPLLCLAALGGLELTHLTLAYLRVNDIAMKVADNAARIRISIDESDVNQIMTGAKEMGKGIDFGANGRVVLSSIEPVMNAGSPPAVVNQYLRWQRCYGANASNSSLGVQGDGATGVAQAGGYGSPGSAKIAASAGNSTMLAEVFYTYQPLVSPNWFGPIEIHVQQSMPVRQRDDTVIKNGGSLATAATAACSNTHAA